MQLTGTQRESQADYADPPATKLIIFEARTGSYSKGLSLLNELFVCLLCFCVFTDKGKRSLNSQRGSRIRVPAIVFDYARHSGATDEGMTNRPPIFAYLVSAQGR
jgi:hypothetical protein